MLEITTKIREPRQVGAEIARTRRHTPGQDQTALYQELGIAHVVKAAREIIKRDFPRPTEDQIQAVVEILRGSNR